MPPKIKIALYRGDDISQLLTLTQNGEPYDTDSVARLDLHAHTTDSKGRTTKVLELSSDDGIAIIGKGKIVITFAHAITAQATWVRANFDLQATLNNGRIKTLVQGVLTLTHDHTT